MSTAARSVSLPGVACMQSGSSSFINFIIHYCCSYKDVKALVTSGEGKYYSTGLAVDAVRSELEFVGVLDQLQVLLARLLTFPLVTIAAINGNANTTPSLQSARSKQSFYHFLSVCAHFFIACSLIVAYSVAQATVMEEVRSWLCVMTTGLCSQTKDGFVCL